MSKPLADPRVTDTIAKPDLVVGGELVGIAYGAVHRRANISSADVPGWEQRVGELCVVLYGTANYSHQIAA